MKIVKHTITVIMKIAVLLVIVVTQCGYTYVTETYTVTGSDTLQSIAERFITKNTGTVREIREFKEGIRELNFDVIGNGDVRAGETLKITYWEAD
ncbi:Tfp pilus assembly protein FimV [Sporomusaceae bacterium BoRhaA]|uniref:LysM peptidoglycan-binding domain-containing protein n=1 Tax=Pelorhabdus rhamnosifermentans TaxID=2772457 RepID=UPI001FE6FC8E|nr:LysM peptidoglycan-binding domain-containing protein [Pelorhabdus rhamnosifermentans]MBU2704097.1 Tfp pilus assembly protein FimV [Pelorhabdus rhamnosifermentans]